MGKSQTIGGPAGRKLLGKVAAWYREALQADPKGREAWAALGVTEPGLLEEFQLGWSNGSLMTTLPEAGSLRDDLSSLGVLDHDGKETLYGCVVVPWWGESHECFGLWAWDGKQARTFGEKEGAFNWQAARRSRRLLWVDSPLTVLRLAQAGVREAVATPGGVATTGFQRLLQKCATQKVWVGFEGKVAFEALKVEGVEAAAITIPTWPWGKADLEKALVGFEEKATAPAVVAEPKDNSALWNGRRWEVKGVEKGGVRLKATVKVGSPVEGGPFFLETVDLYSARSREAFTRKAAEFLMEDEAKVSADVGRLVEWCERWEAGKAEKQAAPEMTQAEREEALAFLHDPNLMDRILEDFEACGLSGEENNKLTGYVAAVSRKLEEPVSVLIQSRSAAGKSSLQDAILRFVPPEDLEKYTRLTGQALFYKAENGLCHKVVAIEEEAGARDASYSIRNLQSSKYLSIATTEKDSATGKMKTVEYRVKGPVALMLTTTSVDMDYETANRFLTLTIDESREMTERILVHQRRLETVEGLKGKREMEAVVRRHQNAQRLLKPLSVVNPYAPTLTFPAGALRARRDQKKYLGLIRAIAFLHQYQREAKVYRDPSGLSTQTEAVEYIEATKADVEVAHRLLGGLLGRMGEDLSAPGRVLLGEIRKLAGKAKEAVFTRRAIREACGWSDFQVKTHLGELVELEYLWAVTGRKGKEYVYELAAATPAARVLAS